MESWLNWEGNKILQFTTKSTTGPWVQSRKMNCVLSKLWVPHLRCWTCTSNCANPEKAKCFVQGKFYLHNSLMLKTSTLNSSHSDNLTLIESFESKFWLQYAIFANTIMVAVAVSCFPPPQHSPIFGHLASSQTYQKRQTLERWKA